MSGRPRPGHPDGRATLRTGDPEAQDRFASEVRRLYPSIPSIGCRVREPFTWQGHDFRAGDWALTDPYGTNRDPRLWSAPDPFDPERFRRQPAGSVGPVSHGAGEGITRILPTTVAGLLAEAMTCTVPAQDLTHDLACIPARPKSGSSSAT